MARGTPTRASNFRLLAIAICFAALGSPAGATTYAKFYLGTTGYSGPFNGVGTVYDATKLLSTNCPTSPVGCGPSDNVATPLVYGGLGITGTVGGAAGNKVWGDFSPNFGGLGVGTGSPSDSDQIAGADILILTFSSKVHLTGIGTLFSSGHTPFGTNFQTPGSINNTETFLIDDGDGLGWRTVSFFNANTLALNLSGTTFKFMENSNNPEFYVSALAYDLCGPGTNLQCGSQNPTPIPGALPLFASGIGGGPIWLRRKRNKTAS